MTNYFDLHLPEDEIRAISSIGLAHLGDGVYELLVRSYLCKHGKATGKGLHRAAVELVKAPAQAANDKMAAYQAYYDFIMDELANMGKPIRDLDYYNGLDQDGSTGT